MIILEKFKHLIYKYRYFQGCLQLRALPFRGEKSLLHLHAHSQSLSRWVHFVVVHWYHHLIANPFDQEIKHKHIIFHFLSIAGVAYLFKKLCRPKRGSGPSPSGRPASSLGFGAGSARPSSPYGAGSTAQLSPLALQQHQPRPTQQNDQESIPMREQ